MSHSLPPLSSFTRIPAKSVYPPETCIPPFEMLSSYRRNPTLRSSSPLCSSSPPATPYSSRYTTHHPYIRSSSPLGGGVELPLFQRRYDDPPSLWSHQGSHIPISHKDHLLGPISKSEYAYYDEHDFPPSSDLDVEDPPDHITTSLLEMDSETTSESTPGHGSTYFSDSEEEQEVDDGDDGGGYGYGNDGFRATFFRMSSERGRWKDDPMALKPNTSAGRRQSMPSLSRTSSVGPSVTARPISEPLEASKPQEAQDDGTKDQVLPDNSQELDTLEDVALGSFIQEDSSSRQSSHAPSARDATPDCDPFEPYSSPLPPSSPPFSPMSGCVPSMSRSVSPLSFAPSSPVLMPQSSPSIDGLVLELDELPPHDATLDVTSTCEPAEMVITDDNALPLIAEDNEPAPATVKPQSSLSSERVSTSPSAVALEASPAVAEPELPNQPVISMEDEESQPSPEVTLPAPDSASSPKRRSPSPNENASSATISKQEVQAAVDLRALRIQDDNGAVLPIGSKANPLKRKQAEGSSDRAPEKKQRTAPSRPSSSSDAADVQKRKKAAKATKLAVKDDVEMAEDELPQAGPSNPKGRKKAAMRSRSTLFLHDSPQKSSAVDAAAEPIDEEMKGMLIECMATSRASSMAVSVLCRSVLQTHPYLKSQRTEKEWRRVVNRVLRAGVPPRGSGVFGKVDSSGKDDSDRPLEAQWFYVPELDEDQDRAALIRSMMPRPAKRSETKKYKQYYWRPLDKISRWDPEDDL